MTYSKDAICSITNMFLLLRNSYLGWDRFYSSITEFAKFFYSFVGPTWGSLPNNTGCGVPHYKPISPVKRVVGGEQVAPNSWPWMVYNSNNIHIITFILLWSWLLLFYIWSYYYYIILYHYMYIIIITLLR